MHPQTPWRKPLLFTAAMGALVACGDDNAPPEPPVDGQSDFVSAGAFAGQEAPNRDGDASADAGAPPSDEGGSGGERTVVEGDIYKVLGDGRLLNLNSYRGLQVIDISNVDAPEIIGRFAVTGTPVEMYVVDDTAYLLINDWRGYWGTRTDIAVESVQGGLIVAVDISDPTAPVERARAFFPGYLMTSRVASDENGVSLYAAGNWYGNWQTADGEWVYESHTAVKSFDLTGGALEERTVLDLGGYVTAVQGVSNSLLVARSDWQGGSNRSLVSVIDISDSTGVMVEGAEVQVEGYVQNKFNLDMYRGVLRVVSTGTWGGSNTNHVETFDATDIQNLERLDHETFGDGQSLFATLFLGNKAFFVTYLRVDPFHAFEITDEGDATERSEFIVSGWNDYFRPVAGGDRLIGIGVNDEGGRTMAVSLYDITDLDNANPLLARAEVEATNSWSEASWDDRAFSVLENAVDVDGPNGEDETGLILLPFTAWDDGTDGYRAAVQIYTFSRESLTRRGSMEHGTPVRRSVVAAEDTAANISESELSLFNTSNPDEPQERGRVDLAPNYTQVLKFGDHFVRLRDSSSDWYGWWSRATTLPTSTIEVVPSSDSIDTAASVATVEIPGQSQLYAVGSTLLAVQSLWSETSSAYTTTLISIDMSDPANPQVGEPVVTTAIQPYYGSYWYGGRGIADDCWDCGGRWYGGAARQVHAVGEVAAFLQSVQHQEPIGMHRYCYTYPVYELNTCETTGWGRGEDDDAPSDGEGSGGEPTSCTYVSGGRSCQGLVGEAEVCYGEFVACTYEFATGETACEPVELEESETRRDCSEYEAYRYWSQLEIVPVDLSDATRPVVGDKLSMPVEEEGQSARADGDTLYVSYRVPAEVDGDARPYVRWFVRPIDFSDASAPVQGTPINVPGELIEARGDAFFTRDVVWTDTTAETMVALLEQRDGRAFLVASHLFDGQDVANVQLDGAGQLLVSHRDRWTPSSTGETLRQRLSVFNDATLTRLSETEVDSWGEFRGATANRALFSVGGGLLVMNVADATAPFAQAYFPTLWWPTEMLLDGDDAVFAAGRYGIYQFDLSTFNLLPPM